MSYDFDRVDYQLEQDLLDAGVFSPSPEDVLMALEGLDDSIKSDADLMAELNILIH